MSSIVELRDAMKKINLQFTEDVHNACERAFVALGSAMGEFIGDDVPEAKQVMRERDY